MERWGEGGDRVERGRVEWWGDGGDRVVRGRKGEGEVVMRVYKRVERAEGGKVGRGWGEGGKGGGWKGGERVGRGWKGGR